MRIRIVLVVASIAMSCVRQSGERVESGIPADTSCEFVRVAAHPNADQLVAEFVQRDARGEFTRSNDWFNGAVTCPGHEPGPDDATMVKGFTTRMLAVGTDSATAEVRWDALTPKGDEDALNPRVEFDTLRLLRTSFGWRVESPALDPHVPVPPPPAP